MTTFKFKIPRLPSIKRFTVCFLLSHLVRLNCKKLFECNGFTLKWGARRWCRSNCIPITVVPVLIVLVILSTLLNHVENKHLANSTGLGGDSVFTCTDSCKIEIVESIPVGLVYPNGSTTHPSTYRSWMDLIASAKKSIEITTYHWKMQKPAYHTEDNSEEVQNVFDALLKAGRDKGVKLRFVQNIPSHVSPNNSLEYLTQKANAQVRTLNFTNIFGAGVFHTKLWLIDRTHAYVGSANVEWNSLVWFKELGLMAVNCSCLANDISKIFDVYWKYAEDGKVPGSWPESLTTKINVNNPMNLTSDHNEYRTFVTSSPSFLSSRGRTDDLEAILHCIKKAKKFIYVAVADYCPLKKHGSKLEYWPIIDDALRSVAIEQQVNIRLLISWSKRSIPLVHYSLKSLADLTNSYRNVKIEVKRSFIRKKPNWKKVPLPNVNHNKYMVTDSAAYVGTSNWSADYFISTTGISLVLEDVGTNNTGSIRQQLEDIFHRDWNSQYAYPLNETFSDIEFEDTL